MGAWYLSGDVHWEAVTGIHAAVWRGVWQWRWALGTSEWSWASCERRWDPFVALQMGRKRDLTPLCCCWILINSGKRGGEKDWWDLYGKNQPWLPCRSTLKSTEAFSHLMGISWLYNFVASLLLKGISDCETWGTSFALPFWHDAFIKRCCKLIE